MQSINSLLLLTGKLPLNSVERRFYSKEQDFISLFSLRCSLLDIIYLFQWYNFIMQVFFIMKANPKSNIKGYRKKKCTGKAKEKIERPQSDAYSMRKCRNI